MTWEELYITYSDRVHQYILLMVGNGEIAEDLTHDTFLKVKGTIHQFRGDSSYYTWVISIARHVVYDHWKKKKRIRFLPLKSSHPVIDNKTPEEIVEKGEAVHELYEGIKKLKITYQEVLILRKIEEFSVKETAQALSWSESKVKSTTMRALEALKVELQKDRKEGDYNDKTERIQ
ncbi:RNA polymerase sigma factor [Evansella sp. AB-P1]|uniref:RNA polymerase sigma factor n=1 Tax=Evansella sp. AB-P1 TaxID=3037653 RepID=UPI00241C410D|nr:RNA polymerase sigma factor [Evansella sp. AB-P1]MDG5786069.1 RNA polymerase sigma factor [Evansella sp. AB-P1]